VAVITNIGVSHRGNFESDDGIFHAKMEITEFLEKESLLVINGDDARLASVRKMTNGFRVMSAGAAVDNDFRIENLLFMQGGPTEYREPAERERFRDQWQEGYESRDSGVMFEIVHGDDRGSFVLNAPGRHNGLAAALAACALSEAGVGLRDTAQALRSYAPTERRLFPRYAGGALILDDTYNASPDSMMSGIETLAAMNGARRIAALGAMNDLGPASESLHENIGEFAANAGIDMLVTVGEPTLAIERGAKKVKTRGGQELEFMHFDEANIAASELRLQRRPGDVYLVKGSNATGMKNVADALAEGEYA
jgi:UDP-N-acetylmuramoyl-tripeptide--D-alanyl-D-alanine ligase